ncbi:MAG: tape measure protein [Lachnospiraceae bacterium]|nr:tape measure protein [Lachnospiraceae bacterium]
MSSIQAAAELQSNFTSMLYQTVESINLEVAAARSHIQPVQSNQLQLIDRQQNMDSVMGGMNVSAAEGAYLRLSRTVSTTASYIEHNVEAQEQLNNEMEESSNKAEEFIQAVKNVAAIAKAKFAEAAEMSDQMVVTTARLDTMNDGAQTTPELQNMIFQSAERSRGSYQGTVDAVTQMNSMAGGAFSSSEETIGFVEQVNKQSTLAGADASGSSEVMQQLTQVMSSGVLQGEEYNNILAQAPNIIQTIADYMNVPKEQLRSMAEEGGISADVIKAAMFSAADETNAKFADMPMTFEQIQTSLQNNLQMALQPVLEQISEIANSEEFQMFLNGIIQGMYLLATVVSWVFELMSGIGNFIAENWSVISPIIYGIIAALAVYAIYLGIVKGMELLSAAVTAVMTGLKLLGAAATMLLTGATWAQATAQMGLNSAMYACPIVWIIILMIALIAIFYAIVAAINHFAGTTVSATGIIIGALAVAGAFIWNLFATLFNFVVDIFCMLWNFIAMFANFFGNIFNDPINAIAHLFADLADWILSVLESLASAIDTVFGSNLSGTVAGWRDSLDDWVDKTFGEEEEVMKKLDGSDYHLDRLGYKDAWDAGYGLGQGIENALSGLFNKDEMPGEKDFGKDLGNSGGFGGGGLGDGIANGLNNSGAAGNLNDIAGNTGAMAESMSISQEDLKYLRDIAEQETVNRFTVAEISIDQSGMQNTIKNGDDIDGFMAKLTNSVSEAVDRMVEGVHD